MKKILWAVASVILLCNFSFAAEKSGFIFGLGGGQDSSKISSKLSSNSQDENQTFKVLYHSYEALLGYKHFFNENWALRGYLNYETQLDSVANSNGDDKARFVNSNLGLNIDALFNFYNALDSSSGVFLGAAFVNSAYKKINNSFFYEDKAKSFDIWANLGYRLNYDFGPFSYAWELGAKIPLKAKAEYSFDQIDENSQTTKINNTIKQSYKLYTRLIFSF